MLGREYQTGMGSQGLEYFCAFITTAPYQSSLIRSDDLRRAQTINAAFLMMLLQIDHHLENLAVR